MAYSRVRTLAPEFVEHVLPKLRAKPVTADDVNPENTADFTNELNAAKKHALDTYFGHLNTDVETEDLDTPMRDGYITKLRRYAPRTGAKSGMPVVYSLHGGAYISGDIDSEDLINRQLCLSCQTLVFSIEYRLALKYKLLEHQFLDAEDGLKWCRDNAGKYGGDLGSGIVVSGTSAGGTLVAMLGYRAKSLNIQIRGLIVRQGAFVFGPYKDVVPPDWMPYLKSREENWEAPILSGAACEALIGLVPLPREAIVDPYNFPIFASTDELKGFPPAYIETCECDPLADEAELFAVKLREAGVPTIVKTYKGMPHGFHVHHVLQAARDEMADLGAGLHWILDQVGSSS